MLADFGGYVYGLYSENTRASCNADVSIELPWFVSKSCLFPIGFVWKIIHKYVAVIWWSNIVLNEKDVAFDMVTQQKSIWLFL